MVTMATTGQGGINGGLRGIRNGEGKKSVAEKCVPNSFIVTRDIAMAFGSLL